MIALCVKHFQSGFMLSVLETIQVILHHLGLVSSQLNPYLWKVMVGCAILRKEKGLHLLVFE